MAEHAEDPEQKPYSQAEPVAEVEYLPVVGLDDEDDGRGEDDTPEDLAEAREATEHTHEGVIGHRAA